MMTLIRALNAMFMLLIVLHIWSSAISEGNPPTVADAKVPLYPPLARATRVQGIVRVRITTDGHRVVSAVAEERSADFGCRRRGQCPFMAVYYSRAHIFRGDLYIQACAQLEEWI